MKPNRIRGSSWPIGSRPGEVSHVGKVSTFAEGLLKGKRVQGFMLNGRTWVVPENDRVKHLLMEAKRYGDRISLTGIKDPKTKAVVAGSITFKNGTFVTGVPSKVDDGNPIGLDYNLNGTRVRVDESIASEVRQAARKGHLVHLSGPEREGVLHAYTLQRMQLETEGPRPVAGPGSTKSLPEQL